MTTGSLQETDAGRLAAATDASQLRLSLGNPEEFGPIFDRYFADIHRYVASRLGIQVADDVAAEVFEIAFRKRALFDSTRGTVRGWLYGIASKQLSRHGRAEIRRLRALANAAPALESEGHEEAAADRVSAQARHRELALAVAALNAGDRDVLLLAALGGLTHEEISSALGIPYGTVGSRLSRARRKLRIVLGATQSEGAGEHGPHKHEESHG